MSVWADVHAPGHQISRRFERLVDGVWIVVDQTHQHGKRRIPKRAGGRPGQGRPRTQPRHPQGASGRCPQRELPTRGSALTPAVLSHFPVPLVDAGPTMRVQWRPGIAGAPPLLPVALVTPHLRALATARFFCSDPAVARQSLNLEPAKLLWCATATESMMFFVWLR